MPALQIEERESVPVAHDERPSPAAEPLLEVRGLRIELASGADVVSEVSFALRAGEILGLVGESGSGKTTIATALLGYARTGARIASGSIRIGDVDILTLSEEQLREVRGRVVSHVAQDPAVSLNPLLRIGRHLDEILAVHEPSLDAQAREQRILDVFRDVGLPDEPEFLRRFPHQLSGGQQQRVQLALAFVLRPRLIVLDEPTTALDVTTQARVLSKIRQLCRNYGVAAVYVSHDLAVVRELADRVVVLYAGRVVESAPLQTLFATPAHPYSQGLLAAVTDVAERRALQPIAGQAPAPGTRPHGCSFAPRCPLKAPECTTRAPELVGVSGEHRAACFRLDAGPAFSPRVLDTTQSRKHEPASPLLEVSHLNAFYGPAQVLFDLSLEVHPGECLALVGESGSGKTTIARAIAGLGDNATGRMLYDGQALPLSARSRKSGLRHQVQYIFQNPYRALNPRHTVGEILTTAVRHFFSIGRAEAAQRVAAVLSRVSLQPALMRVYPRELSGGERQRVAIARALVCEPRLLICDEITSALDVSVQATILALLRELQEGGLSVLFVTHDLGIVRTIADRVIVLHKGRVVEQGGVEAVLDTPQAPYTQALVNDSPSLLEREPNIQATQRLRLRVQGVEGQ